MNNEKYNQIIDEAYENYSKEYEKDNSIGLTLLVQRVDGKSVYRKPDKQMFIDLCTYEKAFSEKWGLKIEERELSLDERLIIANKNEDWKSDVKLEYERGIDCNLNALCNIHDIPTKLITITYKNETIEIYE